MTLDNELEIDASDLREFGAFAVHVEQVARQRGFTLDQGTEQLERRLCLREALARHPVAPHDMRFTQSVRLAAYAEAIGRGTDYALGTDQARAEISERFMRIYSRRGPDQLALGNDAIRTTFRLRDDVRVTRPASVQGAAVRASAPVTKPTTGYRMDRAGRAIPGVDCDCRGADPSCVCHYERAVNLAASAVERVANAAERFAAIANGEPPPPEVLRIEAAAPARPRVDPGAFDRALDAAAKAHGLNLSVAGDAAKATDLVIAQRPELLGAGAPGAP